MIAHPGRKGTATHSGNTLKLPENDGHDHSCDCHEKRIADLELSHDELRAALIVAARETKNSPSAKSTLRF
jgi:hypothetical protein